MEEVIAQVFGPPANRRRVQRQGGEPRGIEMKGGVVMMNEIFEKKI